MVRVAVFALAAVAALFLSTVVRAQDGAVFALTSPAFAAGGMIPGQYTCGGSNESPALDWTSAPPAARSFVLILDDPDAPGGLWTHWIVYNLSPGVHALPADAGRRRGLGVGAETGLNSFRQQGYGGPCPPSGTHRYYFRLYALDRVLDLAAGASSDVKTVKNAMAGHILATAELMGRYAKASDSP